MLGYSEGSVSILSYFFSCFFPVSKLYNFGLQIIPPISDHLKFMASVDFGDFQWLGYYKGSVSILSYFSSCFFLVCKLYKSGLYILIFQTWAMFYLSVFSIYFLVFSVFKYLESIFSSNFS